MNLFNRLERMLFHSNRRSQIEMSKNKRIRLHATCDVLEISDTACVFLTRDGKKYKIVGQNLKIKAYSDMFVEIIGAPIEGFFVGDQE